MPNQCYLSVWCDSFPEERMIERFERFLGVVPFSEKRPGFTYLTIRAVDAAESPLLEQDLRSTPLDPAGIAELCRDHVHSDCAFEAQASWDLWAFDAASDTGWRNDAQPLELVCNGMDYDGNIWQENGHLLANLGFEHFFTGHAGLLGIRDKTPTPAQSPEEARFLEAMAWPENLEKYQERTRENIRRLMDWVRSVQKAIPDGSVKLWSEGEDNFEARLEEIIAAR